MLKAAGRAEVHRNRMPGTTARICREQCGGMVVSNDQELWMALGLVTLVGAPYRGRSVGHGV